MERRTRIVCTLGPASRTPTIVGELVVAGMDIARLNFAHGSPREHLSTAARVREAARAAGRIVRVMVDVEGPKARIGRLPRPLQFAAGEDVVFSPTPRGPRGIPLRDRRILEALAEGDRVFLDDGAVELEVLDRSARDRVRCRVLFGGSLGSRCGLVIQGKDVDLPRFSAKDLTALRAALEMRADYVAQSMVRTPEDVAALRKRLRGRIPIVAKIETPGALAHLEAIAEGSWGMMVARGDLGVGIPRAEVPLRQKEILEVCRRRGRFGIVATEMLLSMVHNSRPTRAEVSDVATAVLDGCDAVMLSEETAVGDHPVAAVVEIRGIIEGVERSPWYRPRPAPLH